MVYVCYTGRTGYKMFCGYSLGGGGLNCMRRSTPKCYFWMWLIVLSLVWACSSNASSWSNLLTRVIHDTLDSLNVKPGLFHLLVQTGGELVLLGMDEGVAVIKNTSAQTLVPLLGGEPIYKLGSVHWGRSSPHTLTPFVHHYWVLYYVDNIIIKVSLGMQWDSRS